MRPSITRFANRLRPSSNTKHFFAAVATLLLCFGSNVALGDDAQQILDATGVKGGLVVHLGCGDGTLTTELHASDSFLVHGLDLDEADIRTAREHIESEGLYGKVSADVLTSDRLPYIDNLVNLLVAEDLGDVSMDEVTRVLCPEGVAYVKQDGEWTKTVKPRPDNIDEWTHYLHDPSNNPVAHDTAIGPPRRIQWVGSPRWSRHHDHMSAVSAMVSANGRVYYVIDEATRYSIFTPPKWTLVARDAFNGTILWKKPLESWHTHMWRLKSGPADLPRRLVAVGDTLYATLAYDGEVTAIDGATGEVKREYTSTAETQEIIYVDGTLYVLANRPVDEEKPQISEKGQQGARWLRYSKGQTIMAVETENNSIPWQVKTPCAPLTLCANDKQVFYFDGEHVVSRDRKTGEELWKSEPMPSWNRMTANYGPRLVIHDDVVLFSGGENMVPHRGGKDSMFSFNIKTGKTLWTAPHPPSGYQSPEDLMVQGGLVWCGETTSGGQSGRLTGRDPKSGEVKIEFDPNVDPYWFHHRCYIAKATDNYLLMSRTGVEFVDPDKEDWEIHHWVRGACLYGILPANGMVYAPQHPCSCYPEAKLYGMNALAPAAEGKRIDREPKQRLIRGHAYGMVEAGKAGDSDWPTYRGSPARSGYTSASVPAKLRSSWTTKIGDRLSSVVVAEGKLFVADVDTHTVHALDADSGDKAWSYTVGGRVDSPPTVWKGRVYFGSTDGWVYCLRAENGELVWQFLAAPMDERHIYFEQLESVWPVHGSVLVLDEGFSASGKPEVQFVAGRNMFLDGGLWMYRLNAETGDTISVSHFDDRDPETGENLQERHQTLQMPVALSDILASNGKHVFMKSQVFDLQGNRREIGPNSGDFSKQVSIQGGEKAHIFCPTGYLDDEWWHRTYWVFGRSFAGGHGGYHRAGVFTPSGRILVSDGEQVFGFGRKPQYYKWTTPIEHQLFCANKPEEVVGPPPGGGNSSGIGVNVDNKPSLDPTGKPLTVEAWVMAEKPGGVIVARGGPAEGYALVLDKGKPQFIVRADGDVNAIKGSKNAVGKWVHIAGVLTADKKMQLYVDGELAASGEAKSLITTEPAQALQVGVDDAGSVGDYAVNFPLAGSFDEIRVYHAALAADQVKQHADGEPADAEGLVLHLTFDSEKATDESGNKHHGHVRSGEFALGKFGKALKLVAQRARKGNRGTPKTNVDYVWTADMPIFVRAMAMADRTLFVAGPPDIVDEEQVKNSLNDPETQALLAEQAAAIDGGKGSVLYAVSADDGSILGKHELKKLPVFDGMAAAGGRLYMATTDGSVICLGE